MSRFIQIWRHYINPSNILRFAVEEPRLFSKKWTSNLYLKEIEGGHSGSILFFSGNVKNKNLCWEFDDEKSATEWTENEIQNIEKSYLINNSSHK